MAEARKESEEKKGGKRNPDTFLTYASKLEVSLWTTSIWHIRSLQPARPGLGAGGGGCPLVTPGLVLACSTPPSITLLASPSTAEPLLLQKTGAQEYPAWAPVHPARQSLPSPSSSLRVSKAQAPPLWPQGGPRPSVQPWQLHGFSSGLRGEDMCHGDH